MDAAIPEPIKELLDGWRATVIRAGQIEAEIKRLEDESRSLSWSAPPAVQIGQIAFEVTPPYEQSGYGKLQPYGVRIQTVHASLGDVRRSSSGAWSLDQVREAIAFLQSVLPTN